MACRVKRGSSASRTAAVTRTSTACARVSSWTRAARFTALPMTPYSISSALPITPATTVPRWMPTPMARAGRPSAASVAS